MELLDRKKLCASTGHTYSYYSSVDPGKTTILFLHGFPYTANIWRRHIAHFEDLGYGCIAPDMLGFGGSEKPRSAEDFAAKVMAQSMVDILSAEGVDNAVVIGHDWGSLIASRMAIYHQNRTLALILVAVPYWAPGPLDLEAVNDQTEQAFGFSIFGYWTTFMSEKDLLENHVSPTCVCRRSCHALSISTNQEDGLKSDEVFFPSLLRQRPGDVEGSYNIFSFIAWLPLLILNHRYATKTADS